VHNRSSHLSPNQRCYWCNGEADEKAKGFSIKILKVAERGKNAAPV
jgi:hypothetical protein